MPVHTSQQRENRSSSGSRQCRLRVNLSVAGFTFSTTWPLRQGGDEEIRSTASGPTANQLCASGRNAVVTSATGTSTSAASGTAPAASRYTPLEQLQVSVAAAALGAQLRAAGEPGPVDDVTWLRSWLEQSASDPGKAVKSLHSHLEWRRRICSGPGGRVAAQQIPNQLDANKAFISSGCSETGRPLVMVLGKRHFAAKDHEEYLRLLAFSIDAAIMRADVKQNPQRLLHAVIDLSNIGLRNLDATTLRALFDTIAFQYPSHLEAFWFVNAPLIFNGLWRIINPIIHPMVRHKVRFTRVRNGSCSELLSEMGAEALPENLGGTGSLVPVESVAAEVNGGMRTARSSALAASFSDGTTTGFQLPNEAPSTRNLPLLLATVPTRPALSPHRLMLLGSAMFAVLLSIGVVLFRAISWTSEETAELWHYAVNITDLYNVCSKAVSSFSLTQLLSTA